MPKPVMPAVIQAPKSSGPTPPTAHSDASSGRIVAIAATPEGPSADAGKNFSALAPFANADSASVAVKTPGIATMPAARFNYAGVSPVHTIYVTAQSLDVNQEPQAEIKVMATVERTWDGKMNFLDFKWIPSEIQLAK